MKNLGLREQRIAQRYRLELPVLVGTGLYGGGAVETSVLRNISSTGALIIDEGGHRVGERVIVRIGFPYRKNSWLVYSGRVVRIKRIGDKEAIAVKFDPIRPLFCDVSIVKRKEVQADLLPFA
jgi:hypothetical protein